MYNPSKNFGKLTIPLLVLLAICFSALPAEAKYGGGTGEPNDPYQIADANDLLELGTTTDDYDKHFILTADIEMVGYTFTTAVIAADTDNTNDDFDGIPFSGVFDGAGHRILNLTIDSAGDNYFLGLIGFVHGEKAQVKNLGLGSVSITITGGNSSRCLGGLCGRNNGTISNCYSTGSVTGVYGVGGLVGYNTVGTISNCYSKASVSGDRLIGGLVGINGGTITNCCSSGTVSGTSWQVGGLVGDNRGTITNSYSTNSVSGIRYVGGLVGDNSGGTISNCYSKGSVTGTTFVGGLCGHNWGGTITNCYSTGSVCGDDEVGGLVGRNYSGTITNCYSAGLIIGSDCTGGLIGITAGEGTISNCFSSADVYGDQCTGGLIGIRNIFPQFLGQSSLSNCYVTGNVYGDETVGGLVGSNSGDLTISYCYVAGIVQGTYSVGGLVGDNYSTIINSYATGNVIGNDRVGGLVGWNFEGGTITHSYATGSVVGDANVGGLVGQNGYSTSSNCYVGVITNSYWNIETSGEPNMCGSQVDCSTGCDPNYGKTTAEMHQQSTFAGWDFTTPVWTIDDSNDYPRLWWETSPVLHAEPEVTLGTGNTISWDPVPGANDYYAECAADANFTSIIYSTGWITETSCEFTGLELGQIYWYSVKARNSAGTETGWSNVESSLQVTLLDAVEIMLDPESLKNENMKSALLNKINAVQQMIDEGLYEAALNKLQNDILQKTDGCADTGRPDKNDWIITCEEQGELYPLVIETIEHVTGLMNQ